jgi:hypothetical protein
MFAVVLLVSVAVCLSWRLLLAFAILFMRVDDEWVWGEMHLRSAHGVIVRLHYGEWSLRGYS